MSSGILFKTGRHNTAVCFGGDGGGGGGGGGGDGGVCVFFFGGGGAPIIVCHPLRTTTGTTAALHLLLELMSPRMACWEAVVALAVPQEAEGPLPQRNKAK